MPMDPDLVVEAIERSVARLDDVKVEVLGTGQAWAGPLASVIAAVREPLAEIARERATKREQMMLPTTRMD